jgi:hypothetical protein
MHGARVWVLSVLLTCAARARADNARNIWSHRCSQEGYAENNVDACMQTQGVFPGIEVDAQWHGGKFWLHHDDWRLATGTLEQLLARNYSGGLWVDLKTSEPASVPRLIELLRGRENTFVEIYEEHMLAPLRDAGIVLSSQSFDTPMRYRWMSYYVFLTTTKAMFSSSNMGYLCLMDSFFDAGGYIGLTKKYAPPPPCSWFISLRAWKIIAWTGTALFVLLALVLARRCYQNRRARKKNITQSTKIGYTRFFILVHL